VDPSRSQPPANSLYDGNSPVSAVEERVNVPVPVTLDLAHTLVRGLKAENARLAAENERRRQGLAGALMRPDGSDL
jgi:hypothetical protein